MLPGLNLTRLHMTEIHHVLLAAALFVGTIGHTLWLIGTQLNTSSDPSGRRVLVIEAVLLIAMIAVWIGAFLSHRPWYFSVSGLLVVSTVPMFFQALRLIRKFWRSDYARD